MKKILIIEDDISIAEIERDFLEINGFAAEIRNDGNTGLAEALQGGYDLVLLDIMLPGIDGYEVCRRLRGQVNVPILMVTARSEDVDKVRGLGLGADDYICKPFSPTELVARVRANLAQFERLMAAAAADSTGMDGRDIALGALRLNPQTRRVYVREAEVDLKNKEFELLHYLVSNPDQVFTKEQLYENIWGMDALGDTKTVAVHINRLREKVESDPQNPVHIQTVWGVGYRYRV